MAGMEVEVEAVAAPAAAARGPPSRSGAAHWSTPASWTLMSNPRAGSPPIWRKARRWRRRAGRQRGGCYPIGATIPRRPEADPAAAAVACVEMTQEGMPRGVSTTAATASRHYAAVLTNNSNSHRAAMTRAPIRIGSVGDLHATRIPYHNRGGTKVVEGEAAGPTLRGSRLEAGGTTREEAVVEACCLCPPLHTTGTAEGVAAAAALRVSLESHSFRHRKRAAGRQAAARCSARRPLPLCWLRPRSAISSSSSSSSSLTAAAAMTSTAEKAGWVETAGWVERGELGHFFALTKAP